MKKPVVDYRNLKLSNITSKEYRHLLLLLGWVFYLIMYFVTERCIPESSCHIIHSKVDDIIPFNEYFVLFYVSWYIFLVGSIVYFGLYDIKSFIHSESLILGMQIVSVITYIAYPSVQYLRPDHFDHQNFCTFILSIIYSADTPTGVCPSLHVGYTLAIISGWMIRKNTKLWKKTFMGLWSIMICLSVCFVKQHSFTDVWAAAVMYLFLLFVLCRRDFKMKNRRCGDRRDGKLLRDIDAMHYVMPLMYPNRCDNEAYMTLSIDISKTDEYIHKFNNTHDDCKISVFDIVIAAALKTIRLRPQMNRFIANKTMYQRNNINAAFTVKKTFKDDGDETLARIETTDDDTLESICYKVRKQIALCKTQDDSSTDAMNIIKKLPFKQLIGAIARFLDRHGWMPQSVIATDPYQCSVVLTNLGSIGMNIGYHHLMNWGTNSIFIIVGTKKDKPHFDANGNVTMKKEIDLSFTIDERIADGFYYGRSLKLIKKLVENPTLMECPLSESIK